MRKLPAPELRCTFTLPEPGPTMDTLSETVGNVDCKMIVWADAKTAGLKVMLSVPAALSASRMACRKVPGPESAIELTVNVAGTLRSSRDRSQSRVRGRGGRVRVAMRLLRHNDEKD
jgi:hypothetical protein